jgi:TatD DNase family protein
MVHSYSGSAELVSEYVSLGLSISFSGNVLRPGAKKLRRAVSVVPEMHLLMETDAPDQAPAGSGVRNTPSTLLEVARCVAELRGETAEDILNRSRGNLERIFGAHWPLEG